MTALCKSNRRRGAGADHDARPAPARLEGGVEGNFHVERIGSQVKNTNPADAVVRLRIFCSDQAVSEIDCRHLGASEQELRRPLASIRNRQRPVRGTQTSAGDAKKISLGPSLSQRQSVSNPSSNATFPQAAVNTAGVMPLDNICVVFAQVLWLQCGTAKYRVAYRVHRMDHSEAELYSLISQRRDIRGSSRGSERRCK